MIRLLAGARFALVSAGQNFVRNLAVSLAGVFTMSLILLLVGIALLGGHMLDQELARQEAKASTIKVYLQDGVSLAAITNLQRSFASDPRVRGASFEDKDAAAAEASTFIDNLPDTINAVGKNPLPASINLDLRNNSDLEAIDRLARSSALVDKGSNGQKSKLATDFDPNTVNKLRTLKQVLEWAAGAFILILGAISLVIIMNTIRTAVYVRRREVEIMKLVGATDWFVRWPFILEGMLAGVIAAGAAAALLYSGYRPTVTWLRSSISFLPVSYDGSYFGVLLLVLALAGVALGAFGSYLGVRRFLTV